jgi:hypothetical protein
VAQACRFSQVLAGKPGYFAYLLSNSSVSRPRYIRGLNMLHEKGMEGNISRINCAVKIDNPGLHNKKAPSRCRLRPTIRLTPAEALASRMPLNLWRSVLGAKGMLRLAAMTVK